MSTFPSPLSVCEWSRSSWRCRLHRLSLSCYTCPGEMCVWNKKHQNCHNIAQIHDIFVHSVSRGSFFAFLPWTPRWTPHYTPPLSTGPPTPRLGPSLKFCKILILENNFLNHFTPAALSQFWQLFQSEPGFVDLHRCKTLTSLVPQPTCQMGTLSRHSLVWFPTHLSDGNPV